MWLVALGAKPVLRGSAALMLLYSPHCTRGDRVSKGPPFDCPEPKHTTRVHKDFDTPTAVWGLETSPRAAPNRMWTLGDSYSAQLLLCNRVSVRSFFVVTTLRVALMGPIGRQVVNAAPRRSLVTGRAGSGAPLHRTSR